MRAAASTIAILVAAVMALSAVLLLPRLNDPAGAVWDESYYLGASARYQLGRSQFASHPPLGLMLIAGADAAYGAVTGHPRARRDLESLAATKAVRGEQIPPGYDFTGIRIGSAMAGVIGAGLFFALMLQLSGAPLAAFALSALYVFDTALIAQFRAAQLDGFQVAFALIALNCAVAGLRRPGWGWAIGFGAAVGAATMVRANAALLAAAGPFLLWAAWRAAGWRRAIGVALGGGIGFAAAVAGVFALHLAVAPLPPDQNIPAGFGDAKWVSPQLGDYFAHGRLTPRAIWAGGRDYLRFMDSDLKGMPKQDANGSGPLTWPLGWKPIQYRWDAWSGPGGDTRALVVLVPNYPAWWLALIGVVAGLIALVRRPAQPKLAMLVTLWAVFMAIHGWLAGQRVMYLYHYFLPLLIGWACLAALLGARGWRKEQPPQRWIARLAASAILSGFLLAAPLALHHRIGPHHPAWRFADWLGVG